MGKQRLVLDLSCRKRDGKYYVVTDRWQRFSELVVDAETLSSLGMTPHSCCLLPPDGMCGQVTIKYPVYALMWEYGIWFSALTSWLALLAAESCSEFLVHGVDVEGKQLGIDEELVELLGKAAPLPVTYAGGVRSLVRLNSILWQGALVSHASGPDCPLCVTYLRAASSLPAGTKATTFPVPVDDSHTVPICQLCCKQDDLERVKVAGNGRVDITVGSALDIFGGKLPFAEVLTWHRQQEQEPKH